MSMKLNLPNKLSLLRVLLIPVFVFFVFLSLAGRNNDGMSSIEVVGRVFALIVFALASFTDFLDGYIARSRHLVTDFGKFLDPLADKVLVFAAFIGLITLEYDRRLYMILIASATIIVIFREMAVTSLRLVASGKKVIAAAWLGKIKTVTQMIFVMVALIEPMLTFLDLFYEYRIMTFTAMAAMLVMTVWSGIDYFRAYLPLLDLEK